MVSFIFSEPCKDIVKEPSLFNDGVHQSSGIQIQSTIESFYFIRNKS